MNDTRQTTTAHTPIPVMYEGHNDISTLTMQAIRNPMVNWAGEDYDIERANKKGRDVWSTFFGKWVRRGA